ncbi:VOC family protein [Nitratireductor pacificus]|uniref:VOC domain-containing protein n=1 Tax=Nitratireductor pacificus pht-3B TaxID=391937 RepID=K2M834_9HYPH|nr:VOC family protein [Nitratireductor pacificus]EKF18356.1 hypothetical protein NA2_13205 [Nitratireductor pacificus pht-3B]
MNDPFRRSTLGAGVFYRDPVAALDWLEHAFGFERHIEVRDRDGVLVHSEMRMEDAYIVVDSEWASYIASPASVGAKNTQVLYIKLRYGLDQHCDTARRAGAEILQEPEDQVYGDRIYRARDPEGHVWTFIQPVRSVSRDEAESLTGWSIEGWHQE